MREQRQDILGIKTKLMERTCRSNMPAARHALVDYYVALMRQQRINRGRCGRDLSEYG
jgi:hypothetical protein